MTSTATCAGATSKRAFARHYIEMVVVMLLAMAVFAGLAQLAFSLADSSLGEQSSGLRVSLMGLCMTIPMVAWMAWHHHAVAQIVEMAGSMIVPTIVTATLAWAGALELGAALGIQHGIMFPAMLAVMPWRYDVYARARLEDREQGRRTERKHVPAGSDQDATLDVACPVAHLLD